MKRQKMNRTLNSLSLALDDIKDIYIRFLNSTFLRVAKYLENFNLNGSMSRDRSREDEDQCHVCTKAFDKFENTD